MGRNLKVTVASKRGLSSDPAILARDGFWLMGAAGLVISILWGLDLALANADLDAQTHTYVNQQQGFGLVWGLAYGVALALLIPGLVALAIHAFSHRNRHLAVWGVIIGTLGICALEAVIGTLALANAVVAKLYTAPNVTVLPVLHKFQGGNLDPVITTTIGLADILTVITVILFAVLIKRSRVLPTWTAILFGIGLVLVATTIPFTSLPGGLLLAIACFVMARSVRELPAGAEPIPA